MSRDSSSGIKQQTIQPKTSKSILNLTAKINTDHWPALLLLKRASIICASSSFITVSDITLPKKTDNTVVLKFIYQGENIIFFSCWMHKRWEILQLPPSFKISRSHAPKWLFGCRRGRCSPRKTGTNSHSSAESSGTETVRLQLLDITSCPQFA